MRLFGKRSLTGPLLVLLLLPLPPPIAALGMFDTPGSLVLDHITFEQVVGIERARPSLVRFSKRFQHDDAWSTFVQQATKEHFTDVIFAEVSVGEHGDKESKDLAARFGFDLKKSNESLYVWFDASASLANSVSRKLKSADELQAFLAEQGFPLTKRGRIHRLERLVRDVLRASGEAKDRAMQRYTQTAALAAAPEHGAVQFYTKMLSAIQLDVANARELVEKELQRQRKLLLDPSVSETKKTLFEQQVNILDGLVAVLSTARAEL